MKKIYFENVLNIGDLYLEQILFSFEKMPIVFVCFDKENKKYLCLCDDCINEECWIFVEISNETLLKVLNDEITILDAFKNKQVIIANSNFKGNIKYSLKEYNKISSDELPLKDQYLEMKEYLGEYIRVICKEIYS